jgi:hypothetical protein
VFVGSYQQGKKVHSGIVIALGQASNTDNCLPPPSYHNMATCYDYQLKPNNHDIQHQRYVSPTSGKCRQLIVQSTAPMGHEVQISGGGRLSTMLAKWLVQHPPTTFLGAMECLYKWLWFVCCVFWPFGHPKYTGYYKPYLSRFQRQFWAARSGREYSILKRDLAAPGGMMPLPKPRAGRQNSVHTVTHAIFPRQLIVYNSAHVSRHLLPPIGLS